MPTSNANQSSGRGSAAHQKCFPRRHMPPDVDSFYWFCLNRFRKGGVYRRDDRAVAEDYGVSKNRVTRWVRFLEQHGWLVRQREGRHRSKQTGMYESIPYTVLEHDEWARKHPGECRYLSRFAHDAIGSNPVPTMGTGRSDKSLKKQATARLNGKRGGRKRRDMEAGNSQNQSPNWGPDQSPPWVSTGPQNGDISSSLVVEPKPETRFARSERNREDSFLSDFKTEEDLTPTPADEETNRPWYKTLAIGARVLDEELGHDSGVRIAALTACLRHESRGDWPETVTYYRNAYPLGELEDYQRERAIEDAFDRLAKHLYWDDEIEFFAKLEQTDENWQSENMPFTKRYEASLAVVR